MAINYRPIGFSYREHQKYAQLCKVAGKYNYSFNEADSLKYEMQALMWYEHKNIDPNGEWAKPPKDGKLYDPYEGVAEPTLPFYSLEECQDALRSLITNLKLSDAPKCTAKAQKLAMRTIKMLDRVKKSKRYEQHCDAVLKYKERCEKRALEKVES